MDKMIERHVEGLKKVAQKLYDDGDLDEVKYGEAMMTLDRLEGMLLAKDVSYDLRHEKKHVVKV